MARIGIDCRFASAFGGLGRYTRELVTAMLQTAGSLHEYVLFVQSADETWLTEIPSGTQVVVAPYRHYSFAEQVLFPRALTQAKIDLLYSPHFNIPLFCPVPFVVTVHDLILHAYPNQASLPKRLAYKLLMKTAIQKSQKVVSVSAYTTQEIFKVYPSTPRSKVATITEGVDERFVKQSTQTIEEVRKKYALEKPFFLYVGNNKEHKNVQVLLDAYANLQNSSFDLVLMTGGKEAQTISAGNGVRILQNVEEEDLPALYSAARCVVTASLYEGYCLPVAEAQACHTPVIASNTSAIPEIATSETKLVDPTVEAFTEALRNPPTTVDLTWQPPRWKDAAIKTHAILQASLPF